MVGSLFSSLFASIPGHVMPPRHTHASYGSSTEVALILWEDLRGAQAHVNFASSLFD